jgi:hypothetical protein
MKPFRGKKRIAKKLYKKLHGVSTLSADFLEVLSFSLSLKKGDLVGSCGGFNEVVESVSYNFRNTSKVGSRSPSSSCAYEVIVHTTGKRNLYVFPYDCDVYLPLSIDEIVSYWNKWNNDESLDFAKRWNMKSAIITIQRMRSGEKICDDRGCFLS